MVRRAGIDGVWIAVVTVGGRPATLGVLVSHEAGNTRIGVGIAVLRRAVNAVIAVGISLAAIGKVEVWSIPTDIVDADINVARVGVCAVLVIGAAVILLGVDALVIHAGVHGAVETIIAPGVREAATCNRRILLDAVGTGFGSADIAIVFHCELTASDAFTVLRIQGVDALVIEAVVNGGGFFIIPATAGATIDVLGAAVLVAIGRIFTLI